MALSLNLTVNGSPCQIATDEHASLLTVLREECQILSPKDGCSPQGQCGCCTVLVDGQAKIACAMPAAKANQREVVTIEGLPEAEKTIFAEAFARTGGLQCGFCIPGIVVRAHHLLAKN